MLLGFDSPVFCTDSEICLEAVTFDFFDTWLEDNCTGFTNIDEAFSLSIDYYCG